MFNVGQVVIHKDHGICIIKDIEHVSYVDKDYFVMFQIKNENTKIMVPVEGVENICRNLIDKEKALDLISKYSSIDGEYISDNKKRKEEYNKLLHSENLEDLIFLIKMLEKLFDDKKISNKAIGTIDSTLYNEAKNRLYSELCYVLEIDHQAIELLIQNS